MAQQSFDPWESAAKASLSLLPGPSSQSRECAGLVLAGWRKLLKLLLTLQLQDQSREQRREAEEEFVSCGGVCSVLIASRPPGTSSLIDCRFPSLPLSHRPGKGWLVLLRSFGQQHL